jgi:hypothetical protein
MRTIRLLLSILILLKLTSLYSQNSFCIADYCYTSVSDTNNSLSVNFYNHSTTNDSAMYAYWSFGDGSNSYVYNPHHVYFTIDTFIVDLFAFTVTGCGNHFIDSIVINTFCDTTANLNKNNGNNEIYIYPSIVNSSFRVITGGLINSKLHITLYNVFGKIVFESVLFDRNTEVLRHNIQSGIYFYTIFDDDRILKSGTLIFD